MRALRNEVIGIAREDRVPEAHQGIKSTIMSPTGEQGWGLRVSERVCETAASLARPKRQ